LPRTWSCPAAIPEAPSCRRSRTTSTSASASSTPPCRSRRGRSPVISTKGTDMDEAIREGGCGCGHVRYRISGEPMMVHNCHCRLCQRQTGSTSVVNAFFEGERVTLLQGELTEHEVKTGSGSAHTICRCARCGTALWS